MVLFYLPESAPDSIRPRYCGRATPKARNGPRAGDNSVLESGANMATDSRRHSAGDDLCGSSGLDRTNKTGTYPDPADRSSGGHRSTPRALVTGEAPSAPLNGGAQGADAWDWDNVHTDPSSAVRGRDEMMFVDELAFMGEGK